MTSVKAVSFDALLVEVGKQPTVRDAVKVYVAGINARLKDFHDQLVGAARDQAAAQRIAAAIEAFIAENTEDVVIEALPAEPDAEVTPA